MTRSAKKQDLAALAKQCPSLRSLNLQGSSSKYILPSSLNALNLRELNLETNHITDEELFAISQSCPHLESLQLVNSPEEEDSGNLTEKGFQHSLFPQLTYLDMTGADQMGDIGFHYLSANCPKIKYLNLDLTACVGEAVTTGKALTFLNLPELTHLNCAGHEKLGKFEEETVKKALKENCPKLEFLTFKTEESIFSTNPWSHFKSNFHEEDNGWEPKFGWNTP